MDDTLSQIEAEANRLGLLVESLRNAGGAYVRFYIVSPGGWGDTYLEVGGRRALDLLRRIQWTEK